MKHRKDTKKLIKQFDIDINATKDKKIIDELQQAYTTSNSKPSKPNPQPQIWRIIMHSKMTKPITITAILLIAGTILWFLTFGPTSITFADVQNSITSKTWVYIKYNDEHEQWANLKTKQSFYTYKDKLNFYAGMRDHAQGLWTCYHSNWGQQIHERPFEPRHYPLTAWDYAVNGWNDNGRPDPDKIERFDDMIGDKSVVRFDMYNIGPCELVSMYRQVWADPKTGLPVRIRKYSEPEKFREGDFAFPDSGPSNIYDFRVPKDLETVHNSGVREPEAIEIINAAKKALHNLPKNMRIVKINLQGNNMSISYRLGNKYREESYYPDAYKSVSDSLNIPSDPEQNEQWARDNQLNLYGFTLFDGTNKYQYITYQETSAPYEAILKVQRRNPDWINVMMPIRYHLWPYINIVGPFKVIHDAPNIPADCILLRHDGANLRMDFHLDPIHDYICVKQMQWHRDKTTGNWKEEPSFQQEKTDFCRLPSGQWYVKTVTDWQGNSIHFDIKILTDTDKQKLTELNNASGFFDGEKLIKKAMTENTKITFWAN